MTNGEGIFFGLLFLSLVVLYWLTRDRWRWRRIAGWTFGVVAVLATALAATTAVNSYRDSRPVLESELWGLRPGMTRSEVLFRKGEPESKANSRWRYRDESSRVVYVIRFVDDRVRHISAVVEEQDRSFLPAIQGLAGYSSLEDIEQRFGKATMTSISTDQRRRLVTYAEYGVFFGLEKNAVRAVGVLDPKQGPVEFDSAAAPAHEASGAK